ncbi:MAG: glutamate-5-semialdehyde dehydrogenase [Vampirovibrionales bacterium]
MMSASSTSFSTDEVVSQAQEASRVLAGLSTHQKNTLLLAMAEGLRRETRRILEANTQDLQEAHTLGLTPSSLARLKLDPAKLEQLAQGIEGVAKLPDPTGKCLTHLELDEGLLLEKITCPLGVILIIFESRPDALPQILSLMLKSGNAVLFKHGKESSHTCHALMTHVMAPLSQLEPSLPRTWAQAIASREGVADLLSCTQGIDLVIPRGSNQMVQHIMQSTSIPVLGHADGVCHVYLHASAVLEKALPVVLDAKVQYPAACNALETLLIDRGCDIATVCAWLTSQGVQGGIHHFRVTPELAPYFQEVPHTLIPTPELGTTDDLETHWHVEHGEPTLAVTLVHDSTHALQHISRFGSGHTEGILAQDPEAIHAFLQGVDASSVMVNASTRFADGFRYGLGAEVGISTSKTHARGPVGLEGLVSTRFIVSGQGHMVKDYVGHPSRRQFTHRPL